VLDTGGKSNICTVATVAIPGNAIGFSGRGKSSHPQFH
jgi:hypothetical protein